MCTRAPCPEHCVPTWGGGRGGCPALPRALRGPQLGPWVLRRAPRPRRECIADGKWGNEAALGRARLEVVSWAVGGDPGMKACCLDGIRPGSALTAEGQLLTLAGKSVKPSWEGCHHPGSSPRLPWAPALGAETSGPSGSGSPVCLCSTANPRLGAGLPGAE